MHLHQIKTTAHLRRSCRVFAWKCDRSDSLLSANFRYFLTTLYYFGAQPVLAAAGAQLVLPAETAGAQPVLPDFGAGVDFLPAAQHFTFLGVQLVLPEQVVGAEAATFAEQVVGTEPAATACAETVAAAVMTDAPTICFNVLVRDVDFI